MSHRLDPRRFDETLLQPESPLDPGDEVFVELAPETSEHRPVRMTFGWCPAPGKPFLMGSPESEADRYPGERPHWVMLSHGFWLAKHPVNQAQFHAVAAARPSHFDKGEAWPVESVSWDQAQAFCRSASERARLPGGWKFALPTEAQWEYACRAGAPFEHPFGIGTGRELHAQRANFDGGEPYRGFKWLDRQSTVREGSFPPNAWGLHDLHGQLWEWCLDWHGDYPSGGESKPAIDPLGPASGVLRVLRGGGWGNRGQRCRAADRYGSLRALGSRTSAFALP